MSDPAPGSGLELEMQEEDVSLAPWRPHPFRARSSSDTGTLWDLSRSTGRQWQWPGPCGNRAGMWGEGLPVQTQRGAVRCKVSPSALAPLLCCLEQYLLDWEQTVAASSPQPGAVLCTPPCRAQAGFGSSLSNET